MLCRPPAKEDLREYYFVECIDYSIIVVMVTIYTFSSNTGQSVGDDEVNQEK